MSKQHQIKSGSDANRPEKLIEPTAGPISLMPADSVKDMHIEAVKEAGGQVIDLGEETKGLIFLSYKHPELLAELLEENKNIEWVQLPFAGVDAFTETIAKYGDRVLFTSAKGAYSEPVAEHALALTLAAQRELSMRAKATTWTGEGGLSLYGGHILIVGAGGIATEYMQLVKAFRPTISIVRRSSRPVKGADSTVTFDYLDEMLPKADVVMLAAACTEETRYMMNYERMSLMKKDAVLVNVGRGPLVDNMDLDKILKENKIYGAALDVTDPEPLPDGHPLWTNDRCLITPHVADTPEQVAFLLSLRIKHNVGQFLEEGTDWHGIVDPDSGY